MKSLLTLLLGVLLFTSSFLVKGISVYENLCRTSQEVSTSLSFQSCKHQNENLAHEQSCCETPPACCNTAKSEETSIQALCCTSQLKNVSNGLDYNQNLNDTGVSLDFISLTYIHPTPLTAVGNLKEETSIYTDAPPPLNRKIYQRIACYLI